MLKQNCPFASFINVNVMKTPPFLISALSLPLHYLRMRRLRALEPVWMIWRRKKGLAVS
jgi:hypothetical protein